AGRTLGRVFAEEIARPLGLDVHFALPDTVGDERLARIERSTPRRVLAGLRDLPPRMALAMANPRSVTFRTFANPRLRTPADLDREVAFAYVMNRLGFHLRDDPREYALRRALYACLDRLERGTEAPSSLPTEGGGAASAT